MTKFENLYDFIERAEKNRKYTHDAARGLKVALNIFEAQINDEERNSLSKFKENLDQIHRDVTTKNKDVNASSLRTYKSRIVRVIRDYEQYGVDPTKMANWTVKAVVRQKKKEFLTNKILSQNNNRESEVANSENFIFDFRGGIKLIIPRNQNTSNAIADGELKSARSALSDFAGKFMSEIIGGTDKKPEL